MGARATSYRQLPAASRARGLPSIGFEISAGDLEVTPVNAGAAVVRCCERAPDGHAIGELEVRVLATALVIDRDGVLEAAASDAAGAAAHPVELPGATGYRAEAVARAAELPYLYVFAIAPDVSVEGGLLVTVRSARPDWPAADEMLASLVILTRYGAAPVNDGIRMPLVVGSGNGGDGDGGDGDGR